MSTSSEKSKKWISDLLDDLTHLEINTIVKFGMTAAAQPDTIEEIVAKLVLKYRAKLENILKKNDVTYIVSTNAHNTVSIFHNELLLLQKHMDDNSIRLDESDYILYLRFVSFCVWVDSKQDTIKIANVENFEGQDGKKLYDVDLTKHEQFTFVDLSPKDIAKIKRLYDLGTETVVLQTRFNINGDVITRIEKDFATSARNTVMELHEKHTNLSLNYWEKMVNLAVNVIKEMVTYRK